MMSDVGSSTLSQALQAMHCSRRFKFEGNQYAWSPLPNPFLTASINNLLHLGIAYKYTAFLMSWRSILANSPAAQEFFDISFYFYALP